jgi:hypothetical protein
MNEEFPIKPIEGEESPAPELLPNRVEEVLEFLAYEGGTDSANIAALEKIIGDIPTPDTDDPDAVAAYTRQMEIIERESAVILARSDLLIRRVHELLEAKRLP